MVKQKNESLATEIIKKQHQELNGIVHELETLEKDMARLKFAISELVYLKENSVRGSEKALVFTDGQNRMNMYADIAFDYIGRISSVISDLIVRGKGFAE